MSAARVFWNLAARTTGGRTTAFWPKKPRILVIRRNRMGDMICTLPLLQALRRIFPEGHLAVACDAPGFPIAQACSAVDEILLLPSGWNRWQALFKAAARLQGYDGVIAAKGGFDQRLGALTRLTNGVRRMGYETAFDEPSAYYTDPIKIPHNLWEIHQIETTLRLLGPLGTAQPGDPAEDLSLCLPAFARGFAEEALQQPPFFMASRFLLLNLSSTAKLKFSTADFMELIQTLLAESDSAIGLVAAPRDRGKTRHLAETASSSRVVALATPGPLELAALLERAAFFITGEGGAAHLASTSRTPTVVLWSEGPFEKWHSRGRGHVFVRLRQGEKMLPRERVWEAVQPYLALPPR